MKIIVGLGNPGRKYQNTRHNAGFLALDLFARQHGIRVERIRHKALLGDGRIGSEKILLVKPQTYMNVSGESVREVVAYYSAEPGDLVVVYDDIDLLPGQVRVRRSGSAGTHNGMRSVIYQLQSDAVARVRIGIGHNRAEIDLADYVLGSPRGEEAQLIQQGIERAADALNEIVTGGIDSAMNQFNRHFGEREDEQQPD